MSKIVSAGVGQPYKDQATGKWGFTYYVNYVMKMSEAKHETSGAAKQAMREHVDHFRRQNGLTYRWRQ